MARGIVGLQRTSLMARKPELTLSCSSLWTMVFARAAIEIISSAFTAKSPVPSRALTRNTATWVASLMPVSTRIMRSRISWIELVDKLASRLARIARLTKRVDQAELIIRAELRRLIKLLPTALLIRARIIIKITRLHLLQLTKAIRLRQIRKMDQEQQFSQQPIARPKAQTQMPPPIAAIRTLLQQDRRRQLAMRISQTAPIQPLQTNQKISPPLTTTFGGWSQNLRLSMIQIMCLSLFQPP